MLGAHGGEQRANKGVAAPSAASACPESPQPLGHGGCLWSYLVQHKGQWDVAVGTPPAGVG